MAQPTLTDEQIGTTAGLIVAFHEMRWNVFGPDMSDRQVLVILLLGMRAVHARRGVTMKPMTVKRMTELIMKQLRVSDKTAEKDLAGLIDEGLVKKVQVGRECHLTASDAGSALFEQAITSSASIILDGAERLTEDVPRLSPEDPMSRTAPANGRSVSPSRGSPYFRDGIAWSQRMGAALVGIGLLFSSVPPVKAGPNGFFEDGLKHNTIREAISVI